MAFTRSFLKSMSLTDEQISAIMEEHVLVTDALKKARDDYKAQADKATELQKQLDSLKSGEDYKAKWEKEKKDFDDFKAKTAQEAKAAKIKAAYKKLLIDEKISDAWADRILKVEDFSGMDLDEDGSLKEIDKIREHVQKEYGDYIQTTSTKGAKVETPPEAGKAKMTKEEIMAIKDTAARHQAIAENHELFGI